MMIYNITTHSERETENVGRELAQSLKKGDVVALFGDLGAGKTAFTRGIAQGLECSDYVSSPTFTLVNEYLSGRVPLFHFDLYRLNGEDDVWGIGWDDYLDRNGVCVVEWSERAEKIFPKGTIYVTLRFGEFGENRIISIVR